MTNQGASDPDRLAGYIEVWHSAVGDLIALLEQVPADQWATPTDLPGWSVQDCASHTAHLESVLAGRGEEFVDIGKPDHVKSPMAMYTEMGVVNRRGRTPEELISEIREVTAERYAQLIAEPPVDASAKPGVIFGGVPWTWETLLRNRPLDVWMHEQDIRRAVNLPGAMDTPAAQHTTDYLLEGFGFALAKKAGAAPGTTAVIEVEGSAPIAFGVNESGRGERLSEIPENPSVRLSTDRESFTVLAGGRRTPPEGAVRIEGDLELGRRVLDTMSMTP